MIIMEYHIVFIIISFFLLLFTIYFLLIEKTKEGVIAAAILAIINFGLCTINYLGFMGIGLLGVDIVTGEPVIALSAEMFPLFAFFYMLHYVNVAFIFWCFYKYTKTAWDIKEKK